MFTWEDIERRATDPRELLRAREVADSGKVVDVAVSGDRCTASVKGSSKPYAVEVGLDLKGKCTCPQFLRTKRGFCKHIAAVAMLWMGSEKSASSIDPELGAAIEAMTPADLRAALLELASRSGPGRTRVITGAWPSD